MGFLHPEPAPPAFGGSQVVAETKASLLNKLVMRWLSAFLDVGYTRPLQKDDLWQLPNAKHTDNLAARVEANFYARVPPEERPSAYRTAAVAAISDTEKVEDDDLSKQDTTATQPALDDETLAPHRSGLFQRRGTGVSPTKRSGKDKGAPYYDRSLLKALHATMAWRWWACGFARLISDTLKTTSPLINKALLTWLAEVYVYHRLPDAEKALFPGEPPRGVGYGIGLVFVLFAMQQLSSLFFNHAQFASTTTGMMVRSSVIGMIFRKSLRLSGRARAEHSVGKITTMISSDATRLDMSAAYFHSAWIGPIQIIIGIALLINNLGYSALVGVAVLVFGFPLQGILVAVIFAQRKHTVAYTDKRVRLINEILQGIRPIKYFAWEDFYAGQVEAIRVREMRAIRTSSLALAGLISTITFIPILASILSFITYALTGHNLNVATIFSSLQFFNIIRMPLTMFPIVLSTTATAMVAMTRISEFLNAEEMPTSYQLDTGSSHAVHVDADFAWEEVAKTATTDEKDKGNDAKKKKSRKKSKSSALPVVADQTDAPDKTETEKPFALNDFKMTVAKGAFVAIVGPIGSGKSSILQGIIGEMRRTQGEVIVGGSLSYVPQTPWIMNATIRENILFGADYDEARFQAAIDACSLRHDLEVLPHHEHTEIGERGINLSGGQKARVSLARAVYADSDCVLLDDCLSAVDAHTGKHLVERCFLNGPMASKTRILATHSLSVLSRTDYIYVIDRGRLVEQGTYLELRARGEIFARLMEEFGSSSGRDEASNATQVAAVVKTERASKEDKQAQDALMQAEERATGAVTFETYKKYSRFAGSLLWLPAIGVLLVLTQVASVANNLFLSFWTDQSLGLTQGEYMGIYGALGAAIAFFAFLVSYAFSLMTIGAGYRMFQASLTGVLRSPVSWFDTTPVGRMISRLSKDQDTVDQELSIVMWSLSSNFMMVWGTVALVFYTFPYLGIMFVPLGILYYYVGAFYRRTSVETKRLDSLMRSALYASYNEALTGLPTIRAYNEQSRFVQRADQGLDLENRAYYMTIALQTWLGLRLDALGNSLILGIGLFAAATAKTTDPSKVGVVLSYALGITQIFSEMVSSYSTQEQNMNAVERVLTYTELPAEGDRVKTTDPHSSWPSKGLIKFHNVKMSYRPGLPLVLKGVDFEIRPREKIGIIGRTGAGKSSLMQALFRIVELQEGTIHIDDVDISNVGLTSLRNQLAFVPQDSVLFLGSLRDNLDPTRSRTDAEIISALQRAWLLPRDGIKDPVAEAKFGLDAPIGGDGANYSAGEKQLLALCRALVKNSRIIVLDEATSSVDVDTDAKIQKTIQKEFKDSTLLVIAHRLHTVAHYDRILVLDGGLVSEFDTPLSLFDQQGIFRSLCDEAGLSRLDIERLRASTESS